MNILFIANRFPYPPYRGDKLKIYNLAKRLCVRHKLFLLTFVQEKNDYQYFDELKKYFCKIDTVFLPKYLSTIKCAVKIFSLKPFQIIYFESKRFHKLVNKFVRENNIDVVHTQHLRMAQYANKLGNLKRILDLPDAYSLYWQRRMNLKRNVFKRLFDSIEYKKVLKYEKIIKDFDLDLVCSEEDKIFLNDFHNFHKISILPNGVDLANFYGIEHDYKIDDIIIFTGNMDYAPNIDAVCYFVEEIFPLILKKFPETIFNIVGQKPAKNVLKLRSKNVNVKGFVHDLTTEYNISSIAVSPVRIGAGTLNKVIEPMALGLPVVSTGVGFKGLGINSGEGVILANDKIEFANQIIDLLNDASKRRLIGLKGKKIVEEKFSWDNIALLLEKYFCELNNENK